jgi:hypothetical protein
MVSAVSFFFGITLIYTGYLVSARDLTTGIAITFLGLILIVKPTLDAAKYYRSHFGGGPPLRRPNDRQKVKPRKLFLKVVKSEDDKPTIH